MNNEQLLREIYADVRVIKEKIIHIEAFESRIRNLENSKYCLLGVAGAISSIITIFLKSIGI